MAYIFIQVYGIMLFIYIHLIPQSHYLAVKVASMLVYLLIG